MKRGIGGILGKIVVLLSVTGVVVFVALWHSTRGEAVSVIWNGGDGFGVLCFHAGRVEVGFMRGGLDAGDWAELRRRQEFGERGLADLKGWLERHEGRPRQRQGYLAWAGRTQADVEELRRAAHALSTPGLHVSRGFQALHALEFGPAAPLGRARSREVKEVGVPMWGVIVVCLVALGVAVWPRLRRVRRGREGRCVACGYDLRTTPGRCPECGGEVVWGNQGKETGPVPTAPR